VYRWSRCIHLCLLSSLTKSCIALVWSTVLRHTAPVPGTVCVVRCRGCFAGCLDLTDWFGFCHQRFSHIPSCSSSLSANWNSLVNEHIRAGATSTARLGWGLAARFGGGRRDSETWWLGCQHPVCINGIIASLRLFPTPYKYLWEMHWTLTLVYTTAFGLNVPGSKTHWKYNILSSLLGVRKQGPGECLDRSEN
jgi:hypothetical protein